MDDLHEFVQGQFAQFAGYDEYDRQLVIWCLHRQHGQSKQCRDWYAGLLPEQRHRINFTKKRMWRTRHPDRARAQSRRLKAEQRARAAAAGVCIDCRGPRGEFVRCEVCREKTNARRSKSPVQRWREAHRDLAAGYTAIWRARKPDDECSQCKAKCVDGRRVCQKHLEIDRARSKTKYAAKKAARRARPKAAKKQQEGRVG